MITGEGLEEAARQELFGGAEANFAVDEIAALINKFGAAKGAHAFQAIRRERRFMRQEEIGQSVRDLGIGEYPSTAFAREDPACHRTSIVDGPEEKRESVVLVYGRLVSGR